MVFRLTGITGGGLFGKSNTEGTTNTTNPPTIFSNVAKPEGTITETGSKSTFPTTFQGGSTFNFSSGSL